MSRLGELKQKQWGRLRKAAWRKSGGKCYLCGHGCDVNAYDVDHIIPLINGGTNDLDNLGVCHGKSAACPVCYDPKRQKHARCNLLKGEGTVERAISNLRKHYGLASTPDCACGSDEGNHDRCEFWYGEPMRGKSEVNSSVPPADDPVAAYFAQFRGLPGV